MLISWSEDGVIRVWGRDPSKGEAVSAYDEERVCICVCLCLCVCADALFLL
jgi:hypothetical protein